MLATSKNVLFPGHKILFLTNAIEKILSYLEDVPSPDDVEGIRL